MALEKHNLKNPAVKRILQELKELQDNSSDDFMSLPLEDNIFEWQFAIRGPSDTEFEGGIYHGRIQLPAEYPFKPPSFIILTPNGRFETQTKICLSISNHHPEHWQPSWSVRTALVALIAFMPTEPGGTLGSLDSPKDERRALAMKSREAPPKFGNPERQMLIDEIHQYMLSKVRPISQLSPQIPVEHSNNRGSEAVQLNHQNANASAEAHAVEELNHQNANASAEAHAVEAENNDRIVEDVREVRWNARAGPLRIGFSARLRTRRRVNRNPNEHSLQPNTRRSIVVDDRILTYAAVGLIIAISVLLLKKVLKASGYGVGGMDSL